MRALVAGLFALVLAVSAGSVGCDASDDVCAGPTVLPSESPKGLGIFRARKDGDPSDAGVPGLVPYEWTLFVQNPCSKPLEITAACIVGDAHNGDEDDPAFTIEGPVPETVGQGDAAALRLTYMPSEANRDQDGDGERDADSIAIVVQSNATNFPTLVVPVCALTVPADEVEGAEYRCVSPVTVAAGTADRSLCR